MKDQNSTIRVGLIRCDSHGAYYGPLMQAHDPAILRMPMSLDTPCRYSWQHGGTHYYFYTKYYKPHTITVDTVPGFEIVKLWDEHRPAAEQLSRVLFEKPKVCDSFEECSDDVDLVFINDCNLDGSDHLKLATPGLTKGIPTFVDKPFAFTVSDARAMCELADRHNAPVMSMSILRASPAVARFAKRLDETGGVACGTIWGGGFSNDGLIHAISLNQHVFGSGVKRVRAMQSGGQIVIHLAYGDAVDWLRFGVTIQCNTGPTMHGAMYVSAVGPRAMILSGEIGDWEHPYGAAEILKLVRQMVQTRQSPVSRSEMMECVAVAQAVRASLDSGTPCLLE